MSDNNLNQKQLQDIALNLAERLARGLEHLISKSFDSTGILQTLDRLTSGKRSGSLPGVGVDPSEYNSVASTEELNKGLCSEPGCKLPARARGLCSKHYQRLRYAEKRASELGETPPKTLSEVKANRLSKPVRKTSKRGGGTCSKDGCDRPNYAKGLCGKHFMEWVRSKKAEED